jgi:hypothetical protein
MSNQNFIQFKERKNMPVQSCLEAHKQLCKETLDIDPELLRELHKFICTLSDGSKLGFSPKDGTEHKNARCQVATFTIATSAESFGEIQGRKGIWYIWGFHPNGDAMNHVELRSAHRQQLTAYHTAAAIGVGQPGLLPYTPRN